MLLKKIVYILLLIFTSCSSSVNLTPKVDLIQSQQISIVIYKNGKIQKKLNTNNALIKELLINKLSECKKFEITFASYAPLIKIKSKNYVFIFIKNGFIVSTKLGKQEICTTNSSEIDICKKILEIINQAN